jgi:hypothetical protein
MNQRLQEFLTKLGEEEQNPEFVKQVNGIVDNGQRIGDEEEYLREWSAGIAHVVRQHDPRVQAAMKKGSVTLEDGTILAIRNLDTEVVQHENKIACVARAWNFHSEFDGWRSGGWIAFDIKGFDDEESRNDPIYNQICSRMAELVMTQMVARDQLIAQIDRPVHEQIYTTHQYEIGMGMATAKAAVEYDFSPRFNFNEWRLFDWLEHIAPHGYRPTHLMTKEYDRYPFPVIRAPRKIMFKEKKHATLFRMKWC